MMQCRGKEKVDGYGEVKLGSFGRNKWSDRVERKRADKERKW